MNFDLHKIRPLTYITIIFIANALICPGFMFIYFFNKQFFINIDTFKLVLMGICITMPLWVVNSLLILTISEKPKEADYEDVFN